MKDRSLGTALVTGASAARKAITMKDAKTLLLEFLAAVTHGQDAAALFAEDGALDLPFLHSVGIPWRHRGRQAIRELQGQLAGLYLDLAFKPEDTHVLIDTPEQVFAEYMAHTTAKATGRTDRKSTRLNSSHSQISYAVFCLKKKKKNNTTIKGSTQNRTGRAITNP